MTMITREKLKELFDYDPKTGDLVWRHRDRSKFPTDRSFGTFNTLRAGRVAGNIDCLDGYRKIGIDGCLYRAHRLVWLLAYGSWPEAEIDHINQSKADNRLENLRVVSRSENERNKPLRRDNASGTPGVYRRGSKWRAQIGVGGRLLRLGTFGTKDEAVAARKAAEVGHGYHINHGDTPMTRGVPANGTILSGG